MMNAGTGNNAFYGRMTPQELLAKFGSPLYVYNEEVLRTRCREMAGLLQHPRFQADYSCKANCNLQLLRIIREEGLHADAMSPGEIIFLLEAGFEPETIFFVPNNVSAEELRFAIERNIITSVDSLSQLHLFGRINPGGKVAVRLNPGVGVGHHQKVVTAGTGTKFGIPMELIPEVKAVAREYSLRIIGLNQHMGSLFLDGANYLAGMQQLLAAAEEFADLEFLDFGGGMGIPYRKQEGQARLDLVKLGTEMDRLLFAWEKEHGRELNYRIEPGRYIVAECGVLLGTVHAVKENHGVTYVGTDIGFNVLARPILYDAHHDIEVYPGQPRSGEERPRRVTVVGNICESGDILAKDRELPPIQEGDVLGVMDAGAYGFTMASNYNNRLRPAEVLIRTDGRAELIRRRENFDDLLRCLKDLG